LSTTSPSRRLRHHAATHGTAVSLSLLFFFIASYWTSPFFAFTAPCILLHLLPPRLFRRLNLDAPYRRHYRRHIVYYITFTSRTPPRSYTRYCRVAFAACRLLHVRHHLLRYDPASHTVYLFVTCFLFLYPYINPKPNPTLTPFISTPLPVHMFLCNTTLTLCSSSTLGVRYCRRRWGTHNLVGWYLSC
jgi:hypothetical protein